MIVETKARGVATRLKLEKEQLIEAQKLQTDLEGVDLHYVTAKCDSSKTGATITLFELNQHLSFPSPEKLKQLLVLEYGRKPDFKIYVNNVLVDVEDIPGKTFSEEIELHDVGKVRFKFTISDGKGNLKQSGIAVRVQDKIVGKPSYFGWDKPTPIVKTTKWGI